MSVVAAPPAPAAARTLSFTTAADTSVRDDDPAATNGGSRSLVVEGGPQQHAFLRFDVSGVGGDVVESATLRLYASNGSDVGGIFARVQDTTWDETTLSWNTAPPADPVSFASLGAVSKGNWYAVDVSSLVAGDGPFALRISSTSRNKAAYRSKEASASQRPELLVAVAPGTDTADPTADITAPVSGATVAGAVDVAVDAADDTGVASVDLQVDGTTVASDVSAPYVIPWDSRSVGNGPHTLTAVAHDTSGKTGTSAPVTVTVDNLVDTGPPTPPGNVSATADGATAVDLTWSASSDDIGVDHYSVWRGTTEVGQSTGTAYRDETVAAGTTYSYTVVAHDAAGNASAPSAPPAEVTTDDPPPPPPPPPPPSGTVTLGAAGDFGAGSRATTSFGALDRSGVDLFLALGDLSYGQTPDEQAWCDYVYANLPTLGPTFPFQLVAGNHEDQGNAEGYILNYTQCLPDRLGSTVMPGDYFGANYYFDYPASDPLVRVFMISADLTIENTTYKYAKNDAHYTWLSNNIDAGRAAGIPWTIVGHHKPCLTTSASGCSIGQALFNLLVEKRVDLVMQGHNHNYQRSKQLALSAGCPSFVLGGYSQACVANSGTGVMPKGAGTIVTTIGNFGRSGSSINTSDPEYPYFVTANGSSNGYMVFTLTPDRLDAAYTATSGSFSDTYSIAASAPPSGDATPPSAPANLTAAAVGGDRVDLSWDGSTDDVAVDHYSVHRDGQLVAMPIGTTWSDTGLTPGGTYDYVVRAHDTSGNVSADSNTATATTQPGSVLTFAPTADASILEANPTTNYGSSSSLKVDGSPPEQTLIKFTVSGVGTRTVASAKLRLFATGASVAGGDVFATATSDWTESSVTWSSAPPTTGSAVASFGAVATNSWYEVELAPLVSTDGTYSLRVTSTSRDGAKYSSREGPVGFTPELVVTVAP